MTTATGTNLCPSCFSGEHRSCSDPDCACLRLRCRKAREYEAGDVAADLNPVTPPASAPEPTPADPTPAGAAAPASGGLEWSDPPGVARKRVDITAELEQLQARPGEWAKIHQAENSTRAHQRAYSWRNRHPGFEFVSRTTDGRCYVWARYTAAS